MMLAFQMERRAFLFILLIGAKALWFFNNTKNQSAFLFIPISRCARRWAMEL